MRLRSSSHGTRLAPLLLVTAFAIACAQLPEPGPPLRISPEAALRADRLLERAEAIEIDLTALVVERLGRLDLVFHGLENRVKGRGSLERKIQTLMQIKGQTADEVRIDDTLRYRVLIFDDPPGRYQELAREALSLLEGAGIEVVQVKNYWPPGDSYSALNCALRASEGLPFELQIHTVGSLAATLEGHSLYDVYRLPDTPLRTRRHIFDRLAERWGWVEVPEGVLVPPSIHEKEEILERSSP